MASLSSKELKQFRAMAHQLRPVVIISGKGLSTNVIGEVQRALHDHELIKVKITLKDRSLREEMICEICRKSDAFLVQRIGYIATFYRKNPNADPRKSNLQLGSRLATNL